MQLSKGALGSQSALPSGITCGPMVGYPERILQFGEGNFLRAFADWMVNAMNARGLFQGSAVVVQPIERGTVDLLNQQDGLYTCLLRGMQRGVVTEQREIITAISRGIDPYRDWRGFLSTAAQPDLRVVLSNTTEAGIAYAEEPFPTGMCPRSFPAKVTAWLWERFQRLGEDPGRGLIFLPCELIDKNGETLRRYVLQHAAAWGLPPPFLHWVSDHNQFLNTLVDRIVPGYPHEEAASLMAQLGYEDRLLTTGEIFHVWIIEGDQRLAQELPFTQAGLNVVWTADLTPYRTRKVRILNGAHTMTALPAFLAGLETVRACVEDPQFGGYLRCAVFDEILPLLPGAEGDNRAFAEEVIDRLGNPFIKHNLLSIALNSVAKYRVRVLPSLLEYRARRKALPPLLTFSLAALLRFYRGTEIREGALAGECGGTSYQVRDDIDVLAAFAEAWRTHGHDNDTVALCRSILGRAPLWGEDLNAMLDLASSVTAHLDRILRDGIRPALGAIV
jgi:tagaturonate reductase